MYTFPKITENVNYGKKLGTNICKNSPYTLLQADMGIIDSILWLIRSEHAAILQISIRKLDVPSKFYASSYCWKLVKKIELFFGKSPMPEILTSSSYM